ncbi:MAG: LPS-assembly lipoprotein [Glaciecola sp.]|jgi:LPS-assembly lipoprotein|uniref:LPS-assembly lipoprotein LptE n=1 Tax=Congregibacter sp. TaxID=2744308 RepID=UPI0039E6557B
MNRRDKRLERLLAIVVLCLGLAACGFQLRGTGGGSALPAEWRSMHLASNDPNGELTRIVESSFSASGIIWVARADAKHILRLGPESFSQRNLSVNAQARAAEFDLQMRADFMVFDGAGTLVMERSTAAVNKQMENDPQNVVGKAEEVRVLRDELRRELAGQILRRISFFAANVE